MRKGGGIVNQKLSAAAKREQNWGYIMVAPTIIGLIVLNLWPFIQTLYTSFCEHLGFGHYRFIGLGNYATIFQSSEFWKATWNTILFCILTVPVGLFLSLLVAMLLNAKIKGKGAFRTIFFLPMVCAPAAVTMVWRWIFNGEYGILNQVFGTNINWITDSKFVMIACAIVAIWSNIGYDAVLLLSGLQNISKSYYEAADIDGAGKVTQFLHITLPMVSPTLFVVMIMRLMASIKVYDLIFMMVEETNPAVTSVQSLMYLFYRESFVAGSRGTGSAIVIWTVLLIGLITVVQFIGQKKWVNYDV
ncbi:MAG: sugar ABC transporter permease [Oscillospiraceae bacterium]|nr:sugar ABC transporter permease [Oscillospiraceae bacterium]